MIYDFKYRNTKEEDYLTFVDYWKYWRFPAPPQAILPDNGKNGIMVEHEGVNICAGFIYGTSSPVLFHFEWIVSNPEIKDRELRKQALVFLINKANEVIKQSGGRVVWSSLKNESLINHFKECGWEIGSTSCTEMVKNLY